MVFTRFGFVPCLLGLHVENIQEIREGYYYFSFLLSVIVFFYSHRNKHDVNQCTSYTTNDMDNLTHLSSFNNVLLLQ